MAEQGRSKLAWEKRWTVIALVIVLGLSAILKLYWQWLLALTISFVACDVLKLWLARYLNKPIAVYTISYVIMFALAVGIAGVLHLLGFEMPVAELFRYVGSTTAGLLAGQCIYRLIVLSIPRLNPNTI